MGKGKYKNKNQPDQQQQYIKKKKNVITQQLLMDKSNMDFTQFIPLIPQDIIHPPNQLSTASTKAILKIVTDFNYLLYLQPKNFWATVTYNISFQHCLSSCLSQLSAKWMNKYMYQTEEINQKDPDFGYRMVKDQDGYSYMQALHDVLLKIVYRIMQFQEQDPQLNQIYNFGQNSIRKLNIFNMIKLMQLIQIYQSRQQNNGILKAISRNYVRILSNPYKYYIQQLLPHIIKKLQQNNRDMKLISDRQQFGINYSYQRLNKKTLSPGQQELKRKVTLLMNYISILKFINNTRFISQQVYDHLYYNPQVNAALQNAFYQIDAAYKIWNFQTMQNRLLPMFNHIIVSIIDYFHQYFRRFNQRIVKRTSKMNIDAYSNSIQRFFVDYGKRYSLGKKGSNIRHMTLYKLIMKKTNLIQMLQQLYADQQNNPTYQFNMEFFTDFKIALQDAYKQDNYIHQDQQRQQQIQQETQIPDDVNLNDIDQVKNPLSSNMNNQVVQQKQQQQSQNLTYSTPKNQQKLQFLVSKKSRQDDYYQQLYLKQKQRFKIQYQDQYDDLVDYDKRPIFMDSASSDSDSQQQIRLQRLVSNQNNQKANQQKHIKFQQKQKDKKNQPKYSKITKQEKQKFIENQPQNIQRPQNKEDGKLKYVAKNKQRQPQSQQQKQKAKYVQKQKQPPKQKGNRLQNLIEQQRMPRQGQQDYYQQNEQGNNNQRGGGGQRGRGGGQGYKRRYVPHKDHDNKNFNQKGRNSNKNRQHGNPTNQAFGGGKKYKQKY